MKKGKASKMDGYSKGATGGSYVPGGQKWAGNVVQSRLNKGGDSKWRGNRGGKTKKSMSY